MAMIIHNFSQGMSPVYNFTSALPAGDTTPHKFIVYADMGINWIIGPGGKETAKRMIEEYRENGFRHVFHNGDISYALGFVSTVQLSKNSKFIKR